MQYSHDGFDRLAKTTYADGSYEQVESYDALSSPLVYRTRAGNTITNTFDVLNRLSTKAPQGQATVTYGYDLAGRLTSISTPTVSGDPSTGTFEKLYDTAGRLYQEQYPDGKTVTFVLDSNNNVTKITYPDGYYVTRVYDQLNRLTDIKLNGSTTSAAHFVYDELSRRTTLTYSNGASVTYGYQSPIIDNTTSIAHAFTGSSVTFDYGFNNDHEVTSLAASDNSYLWYPSAAGTKTYGTASNVNEYPTVGGVAYTYNTNGCLTSDGTWAYGFDTENHLTSAAKSGTTVSYSYDPFERQAQKTVTTSSTVKSRYIYSRWQRIADYDGVSGALQNRYVHGIGFEEPLIQISSAGVTTFYHADYVGSIIGVSNSTGSVVNKNGYGPYGESTVTGTTFGYTGQRYDADTGLYYYKYRYYEPVNGIFLQPDPMKLGGPSYKYAENNPLRFTDPLGLYSVVAGYSPKLGGFGYDLGHESIFLIDDDGNVTEITGAHVGLGGPGYPGATPLSNITVQIITGAAAKEEYEKYLNTQGYTTEDLTKGMVDSQAHWYGDQIQRTALEVQRYLQTNKSAYDVTGSWGYNSNSVFGTIIGHVRLGLPAGAAGRLPGLDHLIPVWVPQQTPKPAPGAGGGGGTPPPPVINIGDAGNTQPPQPPGPGGKSSTLA